MIKLLKRSQNLKLIMILSLAALFHFYIILNLNVGESVFDIYRFVGFLYNNWWLITLFSITFISIFLALKISRVFLSTFLAIIFFWNFYLFFNDFNKPLMLLSFIFFVVSFYFLSVLDLELKEATYNPNFSLNDLEIRPYYPFNCCLEISDGKEVVGLLTNWDRNSCFFIPKGEQLIPQQELTLKINFEDSNYQQRGEVVSSFGKGVGIRFNFHGESGTLLNWKDFYKILDDRGLGPKG